MEEKLCELLKCSTLDEYEVAMPTRTYTYLLDDMAEEFKTKPLLLNVFDEEEEQPKPKKKAEADENAPKKKGFFASLFGKK